MIKFIQEEKVERESEKLILYIF